VSISIIGILRIVPYFPIIGLIYFVITFVFGFYPHRYSAVEYFEEKGFENAVIEYEYIKNCLYCNPHSCCCCHSN
jgi:hypothetical protein